MTITPLIICCFFLLLDFIVLNKKSLYPLELIDWFNLQCIGSSICFVWLVDGPSLSPHSRRRWREETQVALWRLSVHTGGDCRQDGWQQTHGNIIFDETICVRHWLTIFTLLTGPCQTRGKDWNQVRLSRIQSRIPPAQGHGSRNDPLLLIQGILSLIFFF